MKKVIIYTDGACSGNPGPGGWGCVLIYNNNGAVIEKTFSGSENLTTNNRMEMLSVINALKILKSACEVEIFSDSKYVCDGVSTWIHSWKKNNWIGSNKKPIKNQDLWQELDLLTAKHCVKFTWVKGHDGNHYNEMADVLAREAINSPSSKD